MFSNSGLMSKLILSLLLLLPALCVAQTAFYTDRAVGTRIVNGGGVVLGPIQYGQVRVCTSVATGSPCTPLANIYTVAGAPISNAIGGNFGQVTTDVVGRFTFGCVPDNYLVQVASASSNTPQLNYYITCPVGSGPLSIKGNNPWWDVTQNGIIGDGVTDDTLAFNTLVTTACANGAGTLWIPTGKTVRFASAPNHIPCGLTISGVYSKGSAFGFGSFIKCDYTEVTPTNGCLWWDGANTATQGNGGGVRGVNIQKGDGQTGGAAIKISGTDCTARAGNVRNDGVKISSSTGTWNYGIYVDGTTCTTLGGQGSRDNFILDTNLFSATTKAVSLNGCSHCYIMGLETSIGAGSNADVDVTGTAVANASSTDVLIVASEMSNLNFDWATNSACVGCNVTGNVTSTVNTPLTNSFFGNAGGFTGLTRGLSACSPDQTAAASQNVTLCQANRAATFIGAGSTIPSNALTGDVFANQDFVLVKSNDVALGLNAIRIRRNNGSSTNTNMAFLGTDGNAHWNFDSGNGYSSDLTGVWPSLGLKNGSTATITPNALAANRAIGMNDPLASATLPTYLSASDNTVDLASVATGACTAERTVTATGARFGDNVQVAASTALEAGGFLVGKVSAADTIKWQFCNLSGGAIDRAADNYTIRVTK